MGIARQHLLFQAVQRSTSQDKNVAQGRPASTVSRDQSTSLPKPRERVSNTPYTHLESSGASTPAPRSNAHASSASSPPQSDAAQPSMATEAAQVVPETKSIAESTEIATHADEAPDGGQKSPAKATNGLASRKEEAKQQARATAESDVPPKPSTPEDFFAEAIRERERKKDDMKEQWLNLDDGQTCIAQTKKDLVSDLVKLRKQLAETERAQLDATNSEDFERADKLNTKLNQLHKNKQSQ